MDSSLVSKGLGLFLQWECMRTWLDFWVSNDAQNQSGLGQVETFAYDYTSQPLKSSQNEVIQNNYTALCHHFESLNERKGKK